MYLEDDLLPISALQHLLFCERQAALLYVERLWRDNWLTLEGLHLHRRVEAEGPRREMRRGVIVIRRLALRSLRLGLVGRADVVELYPYKPGACNAIWGSLASAVAINGAPGMWTLFPVDYKRGKPKAQRCDEVQLCAQALCLEEMLCATVLEGALFYGQQQRRYSVLFDAELRRVTEAAARRLHELVRKGETPPAVETPACKRCSLVDLCMPHVTGPQRSARRYVRNALADGAGPMAREE